jgi:hypothetical protein
MQPEYYFAKVAPASAAFFIHQYFSLARHPVAPLESLLVFATWLLLFRVKNGNPF